MAVTRKNISFAQQIAIDRRNDPYAYGGNWNPFDRGQGDDCSGTVVDELDAALNGTTMAWSRHGLSTEDWRPPSMGGAADHTNGPFGTIMVDSPEQFPADAAVLIALHHGPGGGENSHMWCQVDKLKIETNGDDGTVLNDGVHFTDDVLDVHTVDGANGQYGANNWWYLPGPIIEDGTPTPTGPSPTGAVLAPVGEAPDTLWADVSEFQVPVDDSYAQATYTDQDQQWPYRWISIRSNDGDHIDDHFTENYQWCVTACQNGWLDGFFVYFYWRPGSADVDTHMQLVQDQGGPHPKMVSMMDVESGGNPGGDQSSELNDEYTRLTTWLGDERRVVGYANINDEKTMWQTKPIPNTPFIIAAYGANPNDATVYKFAHQYTDGQGYGGGLPEGAPPFGNCDMNSADGLSPSQLASILGVGDNTAAPAPDPTPPAGPGPAYPGQPEWLQGMSDRQVLDLLAVQALGPEGKGWPQGGADTQAIADLEVKVAAGGPLSPVDIVSWMKHHVSTHKNPTP